MKTNLGFLDAKDFKSVEAHRSYQDRYTSPRHVHGRSMNWVDDIMPWVVCTRFIVRGLYTVDDMFSF